MQEERHTVTRTTIAIAALAIAVTASASCTGDDTSPSPSASSGVQSLAPGQLPTASPGAATGQVTAGNATVQLAGDLTGTVQLLMLAPPALFSPPPGSTAVVWTDGSQSLGITGPSFEGEQETSDTLSLRLEVRDGAEAVVTTSSAGECRITVQTALESNLAGRFSCKHLAATTAGGDALSVDATGTFAASG